MTLEQKINLSLMFAGMTKAELAEKIGIGAPNLTRRIKTGKFTQEELERIAKAMGAEYRSGFYFPDGNKAE